jgi:hypothetical protein
LIELWSFVGALFQISDKASNFLTEAGCTSYEFLKFCITDVAEIEGAITLGAGFTAGAFRNAQKLDKLLVAASFKALRRIVHYGAGGGADLVPEAVVFAKRFLGGQLENVFAKGSCILPDIEVFEVGDFHGKVQGACGVFKVQGSKPLHGFQGKFR